LRNADVVSVECGESGATSNVWIDLYHLIDARRLGELRALASSRTPEPHALGIIGLYKAGAYSRPQAEALLRALDQRVMTCGGCIISPANPEDLVEMLDAPSPADLEARGHDWQRPTESIDPPGTPRVAKPDPS
jgi:hypothetical protein